MKRLFFAAAMFFTILSIKAQTTIGFKIGGNTNFASISGVASSVMPDNTAYIGFSGGLEVGVPMDEKFTFKTGVNYIEKGFTLDQSTDVNLGGINVPLGAKVNTKINYVDVPVLLQYNLPINSSIQAYAFAGPNVSYALSGAIQTKAQVLFDINVKKIPLDLSDDTYNRIDLGAAVGGGIAANIGSGQVFTDLKYNHSFTNSINDPIVDLGVKNRSINYQIGYRFAF
jgi:hypothetical protein